MNIRMPATAERMTYLKAPSRARMSRLEAIRTNDATAVTSMKTKSEKRSVTRTVPFMPMSATRTRLLKRNRWRSSAIIDRATISEDATTMPIETSSTRASGAASRLKAKYRWSGPSAVQSAAGTSSTASTCATATARTRPSATFLASARRGRFSRISPASGTRMNRSSTPHSSAG